MFKMWRKRSSGPNVFSVWGKKEQRGGGQLNGVGKSDPSKMWSAQALTDFLKFNNYLTFEAKKIKLENRVGRNRKII